MVHHGVATPVIKKRQRCYQLAPLLALKSDLICFEYDRKRLLSYYLPSLFGGGGSTFHIFSASSECDNSHGSVKHHICCIKLAFVRDSIEKSAFSLMIQIMTCFKSSAQITNRSNQRLTASPSRGNRAVIICKFFGKEKH